MHLQQYKTAILEKLSRLKHFQNREFQSYAAFSFKDAYKYVATNGWKFTVLTIFSEYILNESVSEGVHSAQNISKSTTAEGKRKLTPFLHI